MDIRALVIQKSLLKYRVFLGQYKGLLLSLGVVFLLGGVGLPLWSWYRSKKEKSLSVELNKVVSTLASISLSEDIALFEEETLETGKANLDGLYTENASYKNGITALHLLADIEYQQGHLEKALGYYETVYQKKHFLSPKALYSMINVHFDKKDYETGLECIEQFERYYYEHPLLGQVLLMKGDVLEAIERYTEAKVTYESILSHGGLLPSVQENAASKRVLLIARGYVGKEDKTFPSLSPSAVPATRPTNLFQSPP